MPTRFFQLTLTALTLAIATVSRADSPAASAAQRPHILGIAHVALFSHDIDVSRKFYKDFLGFDEPFSLKNADGTTRLTWIKINDDQAVELFPEKQAGTDRLYQLSFRTDDAEAMRLYLKSAGIEVPAKTGKGKSGSINFSVKDPDGHTIEFEQQLPGSWINDDRGKHLPDTRISVRMPHVGLMIRDLDESLKFYRDVLGCKEIWRGSKNGKTLSWANLQVPDGKDYVEFMLYDTMPPLARINTLHHLCLEVADVSKTEQTLSARPLPQDSKPASKIAVGVNGKRQINYYDPDGTRVEVMEPTTVDGKPVPPSDAPPPKFKGDAVKADRSASSS
jgi:catechol 2,3-dioxygenase-like lactoylglutathione lyase family enzyme